MLSQRVFQQSARRLAARPSSLATSKFISPASLLLHIRPASTSSPKSSQVSNSDAMEILVRQRLARPVAPHLTIYKPQITWIPSMFNRITGIILSGSLYVFGAAYLAAPLFGWQITSAAMAAAFAKWPFVLQVGAKLGLGLPFTFHSLNGLRHLAWDTGRQITNQQVIRTGWAVVGASIVSALGLALFL